MWRQNLRLAAVSRRRNNQETLTGLNVQLRKVDISDGISKVYFTKEITPESLIKIYNALGTDLKGKVGVKISTGEPGGNNYLHPELIGNLVHKLDGTIIECCTAYGGQRQDPKLHWKAIEDHGFKAMAPCDIMDEFGEMDIPVEDGFHLDKDIVGDSKDTQWEDSAAH